LVPGYEEALSQVTTGRTRMLCEWIINYLTNPTKIETGAKRGEYLREGGELWLGAPLVTAHWETLVKTQYQPSMNEIATSLRAMSLGKKQREINGTRHVLWQVDMDRVCNFADSFGLADVGLLRERIGTPAVKQESPVQLVVSNPAKKVLPPPEPMSDVFGEVPW
jgi:hypothetical protein